LLAARLWPLYLAAAERRIRLSRLGKRSHVLGGSQAAHQIPKLTAELVVAAKTSMAERRLLFADPVAHPGCFESAPSHGGHKPLQGKRKQGQRIAYAYDPLGRRNEKSGTGVTQTYYLSDGTDEIAEYNGSGTVTTRYVPGPAIDEPIAMVTVSGGAKEYFHANKQGSTIAMSDSSGARAEGPNIYWRRRRRCGSRDRGMSSR
jgi:hypothetical protein